jgi:hypothetical protein
MQLDRQARSVRRGPLDQRNGHAATPQVEPSRWRDMSARSQSTPTLFKFDSSFLPRQLLSANELKPTDDLLAVTNLQRRRPNSARRPRVRVACYQEL